MDQSNRISYLLKCYLDTCSRKEIDELRIMSNRSGDEQLIGAVQETSNEERSYAHIDSGDLY